MTTPMTHEITSCEVCNADDLVPVLNLGQHPLCDDLIPINSTQCCEEYPIEVLLCPHCFTAFQRYNVPKRTLFPDSYHYRARFTADVLKGMEELVQACEVGCGRVEGKKVLDIGCNDGSLLDFFRKQGAITFGIEPTGAAGDALVKGHSIIKDYLTPEIANAFVKAYGQPDIITFTNVFAHIEDLTSVLKALSILKHDNSFIIIENHYLGAVLAGKQFDTFYHEHPRTYSLESFKHIAKTLGMQLLNAEFPKRYGGNIRVTMGSLSLPITSSLPDVNEQYFQAQFAQLAKDVLQWRVSKHAMLKELVARHGRLRAKAFPGRAAILIKLLGLDETMISVVYEKTGSMKIGHYVPATRIPILSDEVLWAENDKTIPILNLAWHISKEIRSYFIQHGYTGQVVDIIEPSDFKVA